MKKKSQNQGFTLLEMMVSISILALVLVSVFKIQSGTIRLSVAGQFYSTASQLARHKMAEIEQQLREPSMADELSGEFGDAFSGYQWQCAINSLELSGSQIPEGAIEKKDLQRLKKIDIEISYRDGRSFKIRSWRFIQNE